MLAHLHMLPHPPSIAKILLCLFLFIFFLPQMGSPNTKITISVAATPDKIEAYNSYLKSNKYDQLNIPSSILNSPYQDAVELIIIDNALKSGGLDANIMFLEVPNIRREAEEVAKGNAVIGSHLISNSNLEIPDYKLHMYLIMTTVQSKKLFKGVFCLPDNRNLLKVRSAEELNDAGTALIAPDWDNEHMALRKMGIEHIKRSAQSESMFELIRSGQADWIPLKFQRTPDMSITSDGTRLVPVPGLKITLVESKKFIISRRNIHGQIVHQALEKGLERMRRRGQIQELLSSTGEVIPFLKNWKSLNYHPS